MDGLLKFEAAELISGYVKRGRLGLFLEVFGEAAGQVLSDFSKLKEISPSAVLAYPNGDKLLALAGEVVVARREKKRNRTLSRYSQKSSGRATYLPAGLLTASASYGQSGEVEGIRYRADLDLQAEGLMSRIVGELESSAKPVALQVLNELPYQLNENNGDIMGRHSIPPEEFTKVFWELPELWESPEFQCNAKESKRLEGMVPLSTRYLGVKGKVVWRWEGLTKELFLKAFPEAIDFAAYSARFRSPLLPDGYFSNVQVSFWNQKVGDAAQGVDGSGLYNPDHPEMQALVGRYGKVVFQITLLGVDGTMAKGIVVPREGLEELGFSSPFVLDHQQVKGSQKSLHKEASAKGEILTKHCYVGVMKAWEKPRNLPLGFEHIECMSLNEETKVILRRKAKESISLLLKGGFDSLIGKAVKDSPSLRDQVTLISMAKAATGDSSLSALALPTVRGAVEEKLQKKLFKIATGAGIKGRQLVVVMDDTLAVGEVVVPGLKPGTEVAVWRWPNILATGLIVAKVVEPAAHHMVGGKVIPNTVFMSLKDVAACQGDDDGDIVGVSEDPDVVALFRNRASNTFLATEPQGSKREMPTLSPEGREYFAGDPRGPVGLTTIWRSELLAAGDSLAAGVMSIMNQEAIDCAKRAVRWTDWSKVSQWKADSYIKADGVVKVHFDGSDNYLSLGENQYEFPAKELGEWVNERLKEKGVERKKGHKPLGWRNQPVRVLDPSTGSSILSRAKDRIQPSSWQPCSLNQGGFRSGNLVHFVHDEALEIWTELGGNTLMDFDKAANSADLTVVLPEVLKALGLPYRPKTDMSPSEYARGLRKKSGIHQYNSLIGQAMKKWSSDAVSSEARNAIFEEAYRGLQDAAKGLTLEELAQVWWMEHQSFEKGPRMNPLNAYRLAACSTSPLVAALGVTVEGDCGFLDAPLKGSTRLAVFKDWLASQKSRSPVEALIDFVSTNTSHAEEITDEAGNPQPLHECKCCMDRLQTTMVRIVRGNKEVEMMNELVQLVKHLNSAPRKSYDFTGWDPAHHAETKLPSFEESNDWELINENAGYEVLC